MGNEGSGSTAGPHLPGSKLGPWDAATVKDAINRRVRPYGYRMNELDSQALECMGEFCAGLGYLLGSRGAAATSRGAEAFLVDAMAGTDQPQT
jgi:hypothetical protein